MFLYHSTLQPPTAIYGAVVGKFTSSTGQATDLVVQRGSSWIELLSLDTGTGTLGSVHRQCLFCTVRSLARLHEPTSGKDLLVVGSDAGRLVILEWLPGINEWRGRVRETYGRSGVRRTIPGQYLASDPQGRALMIAAVERQKLVYFLSHHEQSQTLQQQLQQRSQHQSNSQVPNTLKISSPLEVSKTGLLVVALTALDVPYGNPTFVTIELEESEEGEGMEVVGTTGIDNLGVGANTNVSISTPALNHTNEHCIDPTKVCQRLLAYYEVDSGLHQVTRKATIPLSQAANMLLALPGGEGEPGGVLVTSAGGHVSWHRLGHEPVSLTIQRKEETTQCDDPTSSSANSLLFTKAVVVRARGGVFAGCLLQTEEGDLIRITLTPETSLMEASYYDTVPVASAMSIFPSGLLFVPSEHHPTHCLYQIQSLGETASSSKEVKEGETGSRTIVFVRSTELRHLTLVDQLDNYGMLTNLLPMPDSPKLMLTQGCGMDSRLLVLQPGLSITNVAVSEMPTAPAIGIWTLPSKGSDLTVGGSNIAASPTGFIVIALADANTVILQVEESGVQQMDPTNSPLLLEGTLTLAMGTLVDGSTVQVHSSGVRQVRPDGRLCEWRVPTGATVQTATINERQVALALSTRRLVHLEADQSGVLLETGQTDVLAWDILSLALGPVPAGTLRSRYLAMGTADLVVRILDCDPGEDHLSSLATQAVAAAPEGLAISSLGPRTAGIGGVGVSGGGGLMLHVGLANGVYCRLTIDASSGALKDARVRFLGAGEIQNVDNDNKGDRIRDLDLDENKSNIKTKLGTGTDPNTIRVQAVQPPSGTVGLSNSFLVMVLSKRLPTPWLGFSRTVSPTSFAFLDYSMAPLVMDESLTAVAPFVSSQCPRGGFVGISDNRLHIFMVESVIERFAPIDQGLPLAHTPRKMAVHGTLLAIAETDHHHPQRPVSSSQDSGAAIRLVLEGQTVAIHHFRRGESITCVSFVTFHDRPQEELYLAVGVAKDMCLMPRKAAAAAILLFRVFHEQNGLSVSALSLVHATAMDDAQLPSAMCMLGGRLLCGVGNVLRLYDLGKRQLLRKCEIRTPSFSTALATSGWRIFVGDAYYSVLVYQYQPADNRFVLLADDVQPRPVTSLLVLDYETVAVADRMGALAVLRLPGRLAADLEDGVALGSALPKREHLYGAPFKMERLVEFYLGETIVSLVKSPFLGVTVTSGDGNGGKEAILYGTISGGLGALMPLAQRKQALALQTLEMRMREEAPGMLAGRSHLMHRSYYAAVKSVIDGDLCQTYGQLPSERQYQVAGALEMTPTDVLRQLEELQVLLGL